MGSHPKFFEFIDTFAADDVRFYAEDNDEMRHDTVDERHDTVDDRLARKRSISCIDISMCSFSSRGII